jgi:hypothetical protein
MAVYDVYIPDGTTSANFATNAVVTERAPSVGPNRLGGGHPAFTVEMNEDDAERNMLVMERSDGAQRMRFRGRFTDPGGSADSNLDFMPFIERPLGLPAGENTSKLYPLVSPGGREWEIFAPFSGGNLFDIVSSTGIAWDDDGTRVRIYRTGISSQSFGFSSTFSIPSRGLQLVAAELHWRVVTAFDATVNTEDLLFGTVNNAATVTDLSAGGTLLRLAIVAINNHSFTPTGSPVVGDDTYGRIAASINLSNDGTAVGDLYLYGMSLRFREGRV